MSEHPPSYSALRGMMLAAAFLATLAGCASGGHASDKSADAALTAPADVAASAGNATVTLSWGASGGATGYNVKRSTASGGPYSQLAASTSTGYTDSSTSNGIAYYYVVAAFDAASESANSSQVSATPEAPAVAPSAPSAPTALTASAGNAQVSLTWSPSSGASSYDVQRSTTSGGPYTQIASSGSPSYTDSTVSNGTAYFYVVTAVNATGESPDSAQASATPDPAISTPAIPMGLAATSGNAQASLTWSASSAASSYHVKRATTSGGPYSQVGAPTATAYTDTKLTNGTKYYYVISALDSAGESANSAQVSAAPVAPVAPVVIPAAPTNLMATSGNAQASLTWSASSAASSYHVKRATTSGGPYSQVGNPTATTYTDTKLTNGTKYYYVVSALDSAGESANSAQVSAAPVAPVAPVVIPAAPTNLMATSGNAQASLTWSASSSASSYHVKRATTSGGPFAQIGAPTSAGYTDNTLINGTTYYYVVSALDSAGESANSAQVSATPVLPTPPPTTSGTWISVTPSNVSLVDGSCGNFGTETVQVDPAHPSNIYTEFNCQGIWKSTDYGITWTGPINTGTNGAAVSDCAGGITIAPLSTASVPTLYEACIRGSGTGFWKSLDGGVNWVNYFVAPSGSSRQDYYPPVVDPYNLNHLLMCGHEMDVLVQSFDGGQTWTNVSMAGGMMENGGTGAIFFINTGKAETTSATWLWMGQGSGGFYGTWRTTNSGSLWVQVDKNEHPHGSSQIYQPDNNGVVFMAGIYSDLGWGVLRSTDYGQTWAHVGLTTAETVVVGTSKNLYSMYGWPIGSGQDVGSDFQIASKPGTGTWISQATPAALTQGTGQIGVTNNGTSNILLSAGWNGGLWRYVEP